MQPYYSGKGIEIYHGDCRDILSQLGATDAFVTDPPYGIGFAAQPTKWQRLASKMPESWDDDVIADLGALIASARFQVVWGGNYYILPPSRGWLCWYKPDAPPSMANIELAWTNQDQNGRMLEHSISATNAERLGHPTQKPLRVMKWSISQIKMPNNALVVDPFMGTGTTLEAARLLGHRAIGIEIEERYCEIAARRLSQEVMQLA